MAKELTVEEISDKVFALTEQFNHYVFAHPEILDTIPNNATLIFLDADDPMFNRINLEIAQTSPRPVNSQRIYIKMQKHVRVVEQIHWEAEVVPRPSAL